MLAGVILFFGLLSAPPVQAWIVRRLVATQPGWTVSFLKFGVTPGGMEARGMDFVMPGISAKTEPIAIRIAPLRLFSQRELRLERVEAQKLNVIFTPAQLVTAPTTGTPAPAFVLYRLTVESPRMMATAITVCPIGDNGNTWLKYSTVAHDNAPIEPVRTTQNSVQPHKNAGRLPNASRR